MHQNTITLSLTKFSQLDGNVNKRTEERVNLLLINLYLPSSVSVDIRSHRDYLSLRVEHGNLGK